MLGFEPGAAGSRSKFSNHCAMRPPTPLTEWLKPFSDKKFHPDGDLKPDPQVPYQKCDCSNRCFRLLVHSAKVERKP